MDLNTYVILSPTAYRVLMLKNGRSARISIRPQWVNSSVGRFRGLL